MFKTAALHNLECYRLAPVNTEVHSMSDALAMGFDWRATSEHQTYWGHVCMCYDGDTFNQEKFNKYFTDLSIYEKV